MRTLSLIAVGLLVVLAACASPYPGIATTPNRAAALRGSLNVNPLQWQVITTEIDSRQATMSTLFGNDRAVAYARSHTDKNYPDGSVLAFVTWNQQEDIRWFGARLPAAPRRVEFVSINDGAKPVYTYRVYEGDPLILAHSEDTATPHGRAGYLLAQRAAVLP